MPRSSRGSSGGSRAPARSAPAPAARAAPAAHPPAQQQQRYAAPPAHQQHASSSVPATIPQQQGPGMMGQIAANAASIAVGSTMARGISNALGWNGSSQSAEAAAPAAGAGAVDPYQQQQQQSPYGQPQQAAAPNQCEPIAKDFMQCLQATNNDMQSCNYYLEQFKACQAAAAPY